MFLERLQQSPQALRVDSLELTRQPLSTEVTAAFRVTRTVIGGGNVPRPKVAKSEAPAASTNLIENADFAQWNAQDSSAPGWQVANATLSAEHDLVEGGDVALGVHAQGANAELYQVKSLRAGTTYEIAFIARASGAAQVRIVNDATGQALAGDAPLVVAPGGYQYRYRFTAPGNGGEAIAMRVPSFVIADSGGSLVLDNVVLQEAGS
jgi:hypothetical protein